MTDEQQLSALLRLKRYEQPPPGYYQKLLQDIHRRQRAELLRRPLWKIAAERFQTFFSEHSMGNLSYAGAMAAVAVAGLLAINGLGGLNGSPGQPGLADASGLGTSGRTQLPTLAPAAEAAPAPLLAQQSTLPVLPPAVAAETPVARTVPVNLRSEDPGLTRLLSLQESPVQVTATSKDEETLVDARLLPTRVAPESTGAVRHPRYVIDARPQSFEATKVSFSF